MRDYIIVLLLASLLWILLELSGVKKELRRNSENYLECYNEHMIGEVTSLGSVTLEPTIR